MPHKNKQPAWAWIAAGFSALAPIGCKTVHTEIQINASPAEVWKVISDAPRFPEWNPVHVKIDGEFKEGSAIKIHLKQPDGKITAFGATVYHLVPESLLNQGGGTPGVFTFNHTFRLEPSNGGTRFTHTEEFRGIGLVFFNMDWVEAAYVRVNEALKARIESGKSNPSQ
ncbi:MAG: SRPBCC domain-containing protein [Spirochaetia bacterium]|nr:SRPBCC domain-containing protein [Spirochaetia bacterium]